MILVLSAFLCIYSLVTCKTYYVRPISPPGIGCPRDPCYSLNEYGHFTDLDPPNNNSVTMILIGGTHSVRRDVYNFGSPENSHTLHIIGDNNTATVNNLEAAITIKNMILEMFSAFKVYFYIDEAVVEHQITNISILNCTFAKSSMILRNVHLTIKDSNFSGSTSTAIMLYSSTLTIVGHVRFLNNRGYQGGAIMLVGTVMQISKESSLLFQENYAEKTGGAIFVVHPQMMINAHNYASSCFYQLQDYDNVSTYSIQLINNSAAKGGDHIYGYHYEVNAYVPSITIKFKLAAIMSLVMFFH